MTVGGSDDDDERTKRNGWRTMISLWRPARVKIV